MRAIFEKLSSEQSHFTLESDPIFDLLLEWAQLNPGKEVTNAQLMEELRSLTARKNVPFPHSNVRSLAQRMTNLRPNLAAFFDIIARMGGGHTKHFTYTPKGQEEDHE